MAATTTARPDGDLSWKEVGELGLRYGRIPWRSSWLKRSIGSHHAFGYAGSHPGHRGLDLERGDEPHLRRGSAVISHHNSWLTRIDLRIPTSQVPTTVLASTLDECAGVHEMIFLSTLVMMTDGVPQREKLKAVAVMCGVVYVLNILRLVVFYPSPLMPPWRRPTCKPV